VRGRRRGWWWFVFAISLIRKDVPTSRIYVQHGRFS
jgi:hypothetical protein